VSLTVQNALPRLSFDELKIGGNWLNRVFRGREHLTTSRKMR
jgi:hypothetical protein